MLEKHKIAFQEIMALHEQMVSGKSAPDVLQQFQTQTEQLKKALPKELVQSFQEITSAIQANPTATLSIKLAADSKAFLEKLASPVLEVVAPPVRGAPLPGAPTTIAADISKRYQIVVEKELDPVVAAFEKQSDIEGQDPLVWALANAKKVAGKDAMVWIIENEKISADEKNQLIVFAAESRGAIKIEDQDPVAWLAKHNQKIEDQDPVAWLAKHNQKIEDQDPIVWAIENNKKISEQNPITWAVNNKQRIENKAPLEWKYERDVQAQKEAREVVANRLREKAIRSEKKEFQPFGAKLTADNKGVSGGYFAVDPLDGHHYVLKHAYKTEADIPTVGTKQHKTDRRDLVNEYLMSGVYEITLYDRAPKNELVTEKGDVVRFEGMNQSGKKAVVMVKEPDTAKEIHLRSKFFDDFKTVGEFTGGKGYELIDTSKLAKIKGMEKILASCLLYGELDYHAGNVGVVTSKDESGQDKFTAVKIDHGRSALQFYSSSSALRKGFSDKMQRFYSMDQGHLIIKPDNLKNSINEMLKVSEEEIDQQIAAKCDNLRRLGVDLAGIGFGGNLDGFASSKTFKITPFDPALHATKDDYLRDSYEKLANHFKNQLVQQREVVKEFAKELEIIEKISPSTAEFQKGGWLSEIKGQDIVAWATMNNKKIDGKDPLDWAVDNKRLVEGKDPYVWAIDKKLYTMEQIVDWSLQYSKQIEGLDPVVWAVKNGQQIDGKDPIVWALGKPLDAKAIEDAVTCAVYNNKQIDGQDPVDWALKGNHKIAGEKADVWNDRLLSGKDIVVWAIENDKKIEGKKALEWAIKDTQQVDGRDPLVWAVKKDRLIEEQDPLIWALKNNKAIEGINPMAWIVNNTSEPDKSILTNYAIKEGINIDNQEPIKWFVKNGEQIGGKDPIVWASENDKKIDKQDPIKWAIANSQSIQGKTALGWVVDEGKKIDGKEPLDWAVKSGVFKIEDLVKYAVDIKKPIEGQDPFVWANGKGLKIEGQDPFSWADKNNKNIEGMSAMDWVNIKYPPPPGLPPPPPLSSPSSSLSPPMIALTNSDSTLVITNNPENAGSIKVALASGGYVPPVPNAPPQSNSSKASDSSTPPPPPLVAPVVKPRPIPPPKPKAFAARPLPAVKEVYVPPVPNAPLPSTSSSTPPPPPPERSSEKSGSQVKKIIEQYEALAPKQQGFATKVGSKRRTNSKVDIIRGESAKNKGLTHHTH